MGNSNRGFNQAYRALAKYAEDKVTLCIGYTPVPIKFLTVSAAELWHTSCIPCRVTEKRDKSPWTPSYY